MTETFQPTDIIVDLHPVHAPYEIAVFFLKQFHADGHPTWNNNETDTSLRFWGFKEKSLLNQAFKMAELVHDTDYTFSKAKRTNVKYKSGVNRLVEHVPVFFFKDRATLVRLKLYM